MGVPDYCCHRRLIPLFHSSLPLTTTTSIKIVNPVLSQLYSTKLNESLHMEGFGEDVNFYNGGSGTAVIQSVSRVDTPYSGMSISDPLRTLNADRDDRSGWT